MWVCAELITQIDILKTFVFKLRLQVFAIKLWGRCAVSNYCARKISKRLSVSVGGVEKKLRRLSSVGKHWQ